MNVKEVMLQRLARRGAVPGKNIWLQDALDSDEEVVTAILTDTSLRNPDNEDVKALQAKYHLAAMFDLRNYSANHSRHTSFVLYVLTKAPCDTVKYGVYHETLPVAFSPRSDAQNLPPYPPTYWEYLEAIDSYLNTGVCPQDTAEYEFGAFPATWLTADGWAPRRYTKAVVNVSARKSDGTLTLGDVATVIDPCVISHDEMVPVLTAQEWEYPLEYSRCMPMQKTDCVLHKDDLLILRHDMMFLLYEEPPMEIYAPVHALVVRVTDPRVSAAYLYDYLHRTEIADLLQATYSPILMPLVRKRDLLSLPITLPDKELAFYEAKFVTETFSYGFIQSKREWLHFLTPASAENSGRGPAPYDGDKPYVFVSYSHKDSHAVMAIIRNMVADGYRVWYDEGIDPGTEWDKNIAEHIEGCGYFIAFVSKNFLASSNCKDELTFARDLEKNRFLVYLEQVELPAEMRMRMSRIQNIHKYAYTDDRDFYAKFYRADKLDQFKD